MPEWLSRAASGLATDGDHLVDPHPARLPNHGTVARGSLKGEALHRKPISGLPCLGVLSVRLLAWSQPACWRALGWRSESRATTSSGFSTVIMSTPGAQMQTATKRVQPVASRFLI